MSYPTLPTATGSLVVGNSTLRAFIELDPGSDGQVLQRDSLASPTYGLQWSDSLGVKTLQSDLTLIDTVGGAENTVLRTDTSGNFSIFPSNANRTIMLGGQSTGSSLQVQIATGVHTFIGSSTRDIQFDVNSAQDFIVDHGSGPVLRTENNLVTSYQDVYIWDPTGTDEMRMGADNQGRAFVHGTRSDKQVWLAGDIRNTSDGLVIWNDSGTSMNIGTNSSSPSMKFNVQSGSDYTWMVAFGNAMQLSASEFRSYVTGLFSVQDASTSTVLESLVVNRSSSSGPGAAGLGAALAFRLENASSVAVTSGFWETYWETATAGSEEAITKLRVREVGGYADSNNLFVLRGSTAAVGIGTATPSEKLEVATGRIYTHKGVRRAQTQVSSGTTLTTDHHIVGVDTVTPATAITIELPTLASVGTGTVYHVKDEGGGAGTYKITVDGNGAETIDGNASIDIVVDYDCITVYAGSSEWHVQ